ncbi:hypothetical protein IPL68_02600 [Candidatus Saccharibacteria bacterium]|nr:MAG: hypothetical protein IPL68_02600 [Candidatus Saccharibacteria bacterium]
MMLSRLISAGANFRVVSQSLLNYGSHIEQESLIGPTAEHDYDFLHSEVINSLSYEDITSYFGSRENAVASYKQIFDAGFRELPHF